MQRKIGVDFAVAFGTIEQNIRTCKQCKQPEGHAFNEK